MKELEQEILEAVKKDLTDGNYTVIERGEGTPFAHVEVNSLKGWRVTIWEDAFIDIQPDPILPNIGEVGTKAYQEIKGGNK